MSAAVLCPKRVLEHLYVGAGSNREEEEEEEEEAGARMP
jgi:hypothetical protein